MQHDAHVGAEEAQPDTIHDAIDSTVNKHKAVDVEDVFVATIPFSEEYDPGAN